MRNLLFIFSFIIGIQLLHGQNTRKYVNEFMYVGAGARQFGMGKTGVASTNDVYGNYWNPAAIAEMKNNIQIGFMHNFYFQNIANFDYLTIAAKRNENSAFGFSLLRMGVDGILNTLDLIQNGEIDYNRVTRFNAVDYCFAGSYGTKKRLVRMYNTEFSWGANTKIIHRKVGEFANAWGFGFDAGFKLQDYKGKWGLAVNIRDVTSTFNSWSFNFTPSQKDVLYLTGNTIPQNSLEVALPRFCTGAFYKFTHNKFLLFGEGNLDITTDGKRNTLIRTGFISADFRSGIEAGIQDEDKKYAFMIRLGAYNFQKETKQNGKTGLTMQPSAGIGINFGTLQIDYALAGFGAGGTGLYSNIISLRLGVNKAK